MKNIQDGFSRIKEVCLRNQRRQSDSFQFANCVSKLMKTNQKNAKVSFINSLKDLNANIKMERLVKEFQEEYAKIQMTKRRSSSKKK